MINRILVVGRNILYIPNSLAYVRRRLTDFVNNLSETGLAVLIL